MEKTGYDVERGNGFPRKGHFIMDDGHDLWRVVYEGSRIDTRADGRGNVVHGYVCRPADWSELTDGEPYQAVFVPEVGR